MTRPTTSAPPPGTASPATARRGPAGPRGTATASRVGVGDRGQLLDRVVVLGRCSPDQLFDHQRMVVERQPRIVRGRSGSTSVRGPPRLPASGALEARRRGRLRSTIRGRIGGGTPPAARRQRGQPGAGGVEQYVVHRGHPVQPQDVLRGLDQDRAARRERQDPRYRRQRREPQRGEEPQRREDQQVADDLARRPRGPSAKIVSRSRSGTRLTRPGTAPARSPGNMIIHTHGTVP